jgi:(R,R)-butanediol dehydrogenase/meso-butanediol dehydrogenase/diacetyl reductase
MKALMLHGPNDLRLDERTVPQPGPTDVVVRVRACGICGSDLSYAIVGGIAGPTPHPMGLGHEVAGTIESVGPKVKGLEPGMRVVVNPMGDGNEIGTGVIEGAFAPYLFVRNATLGGSVHLIGDLPFETAALTEPLSVARHAVNRASVGPHSKVVVFGAGPIGLGITLWLKEAGVTNVIVVDMSEQRLERARALGAALTLVPTRDNINQAIGDRHGRGEIFGWPTVGTDVFIEASGAARVIPDIIGMARFQASLIVVAVHHQPVPINFQMALGKELTISMSLAYPDEFGEVVSVLQSGRVDVEPLISHQFAFDDVLSAFDTAKNIDLAAKVMVNFEA